MAVISYVTCDECNPNRNIRKGDLLGYEESVCRGQLAQALQYGWVRRIEGGKTKYICPACQKKER